MHTVGISPKVIAPVFAQVVALLVNFIATGTFDRVEAAQAVGIALTAVFGAWAGPGIVEPPPLNADVASDDLLGDPSPPAR